MSTSIGGSGIYLDANDRDAFLHFLENSTASYLTSGAYGITFILTLKPDVESKYLSFHASTYGQPVRKILLKTMFVYPIDINIRTFHYPQEKRTVPIDNFYEEVNIQTDIYLKTINYLEPLCPAIVYATTAFIKEKDDPMTKALYNILKHQIPNGEQTKLQSHPGMSIGAIGMELVGGDPDVVETLHNILEDAQFYHTYIAKAYHTLIELIIKTGYSHGDFHGGNLLADTSIVDYFDTKRGKVSMIDFGFAEKLSLQRYNQFKQLYKEQKYMDIITSMCDIPRKDGYSMTSYDGYRKMCFLDKPFPSATKEDINNKIIELYQLREQSIDKLTKSFTHKHLPLSNSERNKMYNGHIRVQTFIPPSYFDGKVPNIFGIYQNTSHVLRDYHNMVDRSGRNPMITVKRFRIESRLCYMLAYYLHKMRLNRISEKEQYIMPMVHAGILYEDITMSEIADIYKVFFSEFTDEKQKRFLELIYESHYLQDVYFDDFLNYFSDAQLAKVSSDQLWRMFKEDTETDWLLRPKIAAKRLKQMAKINGLLIQNPTQPKNLFRELPFDEHDEEDDATKKKKRIRKKKNKSVAATDTDMSTETVEPEPIPEPEPETEPEPTTDITTTDTSTVGPSDHVATPESVATTVSRPVLVARTKDYFNKVDAASGKSNKILIIIELMKFLTEEGFVLFDTSQSFRKTVMDKCRVDFKRDAAGNEHEEALTNACDTFMNKIKSVYPYRSSSIPGGKRKTMKKKNKRAKTNKKGKR